MIVVTKDQIDAFDRDGYVVIPELLSEEDLARYGAAVDEAVARRKGHDKRPLEEKSTYEQSFIQCINLWEDSPPVRSLTFHPRVCEAAARLLGVGAIRVWHDQALYKEPGGRLTDAHQDAPYWPMIESDAITAWIPLDGSTLDCGAMGYIPGSHKIGFKKFVNIFQGNPEDILARPELKDVPPVFVEVPKGGVAFHHALTFHVAKPNETDKVRRVHTVIYFRDGSTRGKEWAHPSVDRGGIKVGEPIASAVTPLAWPRAEDDLPEPPPPPEDWTGGIWPGEQQA